MWYSIHKRLKISDNKNCYNNHNQKTAWPRVYHIALTAITSLAKIDALKQKVVKDLFDSAKPYKTLLKAIFIGVGVFLRGGKRFADTSNRKCVTQKSLERSSIFLLAEEARSPNWQYWVYPPGTPHWMRNWMVCSDITQLVTYCVLITIRIYRLTPSPENFYSLWNKQKNIYVHWQSIIFT